MTQNGQYIKRGVRTSWEKLEGNLHQGEANVTPIITETRKETVHLQTGLNVSANTNINRPPLTADQLNNTQYFNSLGVRNSRPEYPYTFQQPVNNLKFVPPPPSRFLVSSGHHSSSGPQPSQLPVQSTHPVPLVQPLYQSIRKTYIPHHIYNDIPIMNSETKYYQQEHYQQEHAEEEVPEEREEEGEADDQMLEQYEKLYHKYQEEMEKNVTLTRKVEFLQNQLSKNQRSERSEDHTPQPIIHEVIKTKEVYITKPTRVDTKQLVAILMKKFKPVMDETFERRKASCINKLRGLLTDQESVIKTAIIRSTEQLRH